MADARRLRRIARAHWGVENRLHWVLDVVFGEDYCRARSGFALENLNAFRKLALTLLRRNGLPGKGVKDMRLECAWDNSSRPANLATLKFKLAAGQSGTIVKADNGLSLVCGLAILVR